MNIIQVQDRLKGLSEQQLATEMQSPSGLAPQFLVLSELQRRKRVRDDYQAQQAKAPATTVAQDAVAAAGVPQEGLAPMARALAPNTDITQNTGIASLPAAPASEEPQQMAGGGMVRKMKEGRIIVRGGRKFTEQKDGTYRDERGNTIQSAGQDLTNFYEGITSLPRRAGEMLGGYSADLANQGNAGLMAQDRANLAERVQGTRAGPATDYRYPDVPVEDMTAMLSQAGPEFERTGRAGPMTTATDITDLEDIVVPVPRPSFEQVGRENGAASLMDMANTAQARNEVETPIERARRVVAEDRARRAMAAAPLQRLPSAPDRSGVMGINTERDLGPNSLANLPQVLNTEVVVGPDGSIALKPPASESPVTAQPAGPETLRPKARPTDTVEDLTSPAADTTSPGGGGSGGAGGAGSGGGGAGSGGVGGVGVAAGPQTDYEKAIADALARTEKRAEQDKWMAVAQAGLALMSSNNPTLAGALGEAGATGLGAFQNSRDAAEKARMDLLATQYGMDMDKQKMAMARAQAGARGGGKPDKVPLGIIKNFEEQRAAAQQELDALGEVPEANFLGFGGGEDPKTAQRRLDLANNIAKLDYVLQGAYATHNVPYLGGNGSGITGAEDVADLADE